MTARNYIARQDTIVQKSVQWARAGSAARPGRLAALNRTERCSSGSLRPSASVHRLRKNGYVPR